VPVFAEHATSPQTAAPDIDAAQSQADLFMVCFPATARLMQARTHQPVNWLDLQFNLIIKDTPLQTGANLELVLECCSNGERTA
jgi:hypothetical protein